MFATVRIFNIFLLELPPHTTTSYGRLIRRPRPWSLRHIFDTSNSYEEEGCLVSADYDDELKLMVIVHYRPVGYFTTGWGKLTSVTFVVWFGYCFVYASRYFIVAFYGLFVFEINK